jgi:tetratricopeptide (TPR) repeat protein
MTADELETAIEGYRQTLRQHPDDVETLINLAWSYNNSGDYQPAIETFNQALAIDERAGDAYFGLGIAYMHHQQPEAALRAFEQALGLASDAQDRGRVVIATQQAQSYIHRLQHNR